MAKRNTKSTDLLEDTEQMESVSKDPEYRSIYVNNVTFGMTRFDFQIALGIVEITKDISEQKVRELASVKMTIAYAKAFVKDMQASIDAYEDKFGEIELPTPLD